MLDAGLDSLAQANPAGAAILQQHFVQGLSIGQVAHSTGFSERVIYARQAQALATLVQLIGRAESAARQAKPLSAAQQRVLDSLPPPTFSCLYGVQDILARLKRFLTLDDGCWLTALDGMGGVGKTALARQAVEDLVRAGRFEAVAWVTAQQQTLRGGHLLPPAQPALTYASLLDELARDLGLGARLDLDEKEQAQRLRAALASRPTLLVVDNLETVADLWALLHGLDRLARPAKVLLTTRQRVTAFDQVTSLTLRELPLADALAFLRHHSQERNTLALLDASEADLLRIVTVTDGNPLAIKLIVGQLHSLPLAQVLDDLAVVRPDTHDFYHFLFRYSWQRLSEPAQHLLLHMPLLDARGATWEDLAAVSGVALNGYFRNALEELVAASLLNAGCFQGRLLYSIHRLTEYFILSDLIGLERPHPWPSPAEAR